MAQGKSRKFTTKEVSDKLEDYRRLGIIDAGIRPHVWAWLYNSDDGWRNVVENFDDLLALERLKFAEIRDCEVRLSVIDCALRAAKLVIPEYRHQPSSKTYTQPQLAACYILRLYSKFSRQAIKPHLERHAPERFLIFGRSRELPSAGTHRNFEMQTLPEYGADFWEALGTFNSYLPTLKPDETA